MFMESNAKNSACFNGGKEVEKKFISTIEKEKYWENVREANIEEDTGLHFDLIVKAKYHDGHTKDFKVDVKSMKKFNRQDEQIQDEWIWVEFKNVYGKSGWLYGEADLIAFEVKEGFLLVKRDDLLALAEKVVDRKTKVIYSNLAKYKVYTRKGRLDEISMIEKKVILNKLVHLFIKVRQDQ
jgi:hypothetical protein